MRYISTRGGLSPAGFQDAVMMGLAPDGGLIIPEAVPDVRGELANWARRSYTELAFEIIARFTDMPQRDLRRLIGESYRDFRHPEIAPTTRIDDLYILELFHGPTLAFKDIALQWLGRLFEYILKQRGGELNVLAATSGDTGSAAIYGVRGRPGIRIFVMHPHGRISPLQERQMTAVLDDNVFNLAVEGTFDDCQRIMKSIFRDPAFKAQYTLGAVNSVNWARVLAQIVYYFYSAFRVMDQTGADAVQFSVPTGNFGDILAGWYAARMGLPIDRLILATNENDILARFFQHGVYELGPVHATLSPSMDIQIASNFERYLYYASGEQPETLHRWMETFAAKGRLALTDAAGEPDRLIKAGTGDRQATLRTIRELSEQHEYIVDPHTAVGVHVAREKALDRSPVICLATAHPAKFSGAIEAAIGRAAHHPILEALEHADTRQEILPADEQAVRNYLAEHIDIRRTA